MKSNAVKNKHITYALDSLEFYHFVVRLAGQHSTNCGFSKEERNFFVANITQMFIPNDVTNKIPIDELLFLICSSVNTYVEDVIAKSRKEEVVLAKDLFLIIGIEIGYTRRQLFEHVGVSHSTAIHILKKTENWQVANKKLYDSYCRVKRFLLIKNNTI